METETRTQAVTSHKAAKQLLRYTRRPVVKRKAAPAEFDRRAVELTLSRVGDTKDADDLRRRIAKSFGYSTFDDFLRAERRLHRFLAGPPGRRMPSALVGVQNLCRLVEACVKLRHWAES